MIVDKKGHIMLILLQEGKVSLDETIFSELKFTFRDDDCTSWL